MGRRPAHLSRARAATQCRTNFNTIKATVFIAAVDLGQNIYV